MRVFRQLGTWGTTVVLAPLLWLLSCAIARGLAQQSYDAAIIPATRAFRVPAGPGVANQALLSTRAVVRDSLVLTEVQKYLQIWSLEPGASAVFPEVSRVPWCWNPFRTSALILRLKQKQAFLLTQHHVVQRLQSSRGTTFFYLEPDAQAALGGRRFLAEAQGAQLVKVIEL